MEGGGRGNYKPCDDRWKYMDGMGRHTTNKKRDLYVSTAVKFGVRKGQDGEVVRQVQGED